MTSYDDDPFIQAQEGEERRGFFAKHARVIGLTAVGAVFAAGGLIATTETLDSPLARESSTSAVPYRHDPHVSITASPSPRAPEQSPSPQITSSQHPSVSTSASPEALPTPTASSSGQSVGEKAADPAKASRPNIVYVLTDDLSNNLMPFMPITRRLIADKGAKFTLMEDEKSLCCIARASLYTGLYARRSGVLSNTGRKGGYGAYHREDEQKDIFVALHKAGYKTAFMGKWFNEFPRPPKNPELGVPDNYVPPGRDVFISPVAGHPYFQFDQKLDVTGKVDKQYDHRFLGDRLSDMAIQTLKHTGKKPLFMEVAPYTPHKPYTYPKRLADKFNHVRYPHTPADNEKDMSDKPMPLHNAPLLSPYWKQKQYEAFRDRVRAVQVVDHMVGRIVRTLRKQGKLENTVIAFGSDNGYFTGEHRRTIGKYDQYQPSLNVPLYVRGPGIKPGTVIRRVVSDVDVAPTFADIGQARFTYTPDGISLWPLLQGKDTVRRHYVLIGRGDAPHYKKAANGLEEPPEVSVQTKHQLKLNDFTGVVGNRYKYIRFVNQKILGPREEFYDLKKDPNELDNLMGEHDNKFKTLSHREKRELLKMRKILPVLEQCAGITCQQ